MTPFYRQLPDVPGFGVERTADVIGLSLAVGATAGVAAHAVGTAVQRITEQGMELFGGMGVVQGMPIEKYVRDALVQKHISFPFPTRFSSTEALAGYKRQDRPLLIGGN